MWFEKSVLKAARKRKISLLLHSTHLYKNLPQILTDGHLHTARELIGKYGAERAAYYLHDVNRYEQFAVGLDYINCSLTVPNAELLYHRSKSEWSAEWVHLALDISLLNREDTLYSPMSAATERGQLIRAGREGFQAMFERVVGEFTREDVPPNEPTHPQAEALVKGPLPLPAVQAIFVPTRETLLEVRRLCELHQRVLSVQTAPHLFAWPARLVQH